MEKLLQFVWQHRLCILPGMRTVDGKSLTVLNPGKLNNDAGPDFFNASVMLDGQSWAGNIEIHVKASDWYRHNHQTDPAYDSVILHVVQVDDMRIKRKDGSEIPQVVVRCTPEAAARCNALLLDAPRSLPCSQTIANTAQIYRSDWITALAMERLFRKSERILAMVEESAGYWEMAAYVTLARGLGFGLNSDPFELLAKRAPLKFLNRHADDQAMIEAILFGQAGMIPPPSGEEDPYITQLREDHVFMARKFSLSQPVNGWKLSRSRPQNFPYRRIAMLAEMIHRGFNLVGQLYDCKTLEQMHRLFRVELHGFWATHLTFRDKALVCRTAALSHDSIDTLLINVAIPLLHARQMSLADDDGMQRTVELLQQIQPENNSIIRLFGNAGIKCADAFGSQALIELRREYCEKGKCIYCRFGHRMLQAEIVR